MSFEQYKAPSSSGEEVYVTFSEANSHMRFSSGMVKKFKIKEGYVHLFYNGETDEVGIKLLKDYEDGALKLCKNKGTRAYAISVAGFIYNMGLDEVAGRYKDIRKEGDMLIVGLGRSNWG